MELDSSYWDTRYKEGNTGWDIGHISTPLKAYIDQLTRKNLRILVPGAGNAYEVIYLWENGFRNVHLLDFSETATNNFINFHPLFPVEHVHTEDFFNHKATYDVILEQTFFCAIDPNLRESYVDRSFELLKTGGRIVGLLWDDPMNQDRPPFGGSKEEYRQLFISKFKLEIIEDCYNSIKPRQGRELFFKFIKRQEVLI